MGVDKSNKVVVVGAGLMGTGIAHAFASSGFETVLVDTNAAALEKAYASVEKYWVMVSGWARSVKRGGGLPWIG